MVNGGDESLLEFSVKRNSGSDVKSGFTIPKNPTMTFYLEAINYDNYRKDIFLFPDYEYLPGPPTGYLDVGMGAINHDGYSSPFTYLFTLFISISY
jgi:hypothetical protein